MSAERLPMRKLREILRLRLEAGLSGRAIGRSCNLSPSTISEYLGRIAVAKLTWPLPAALDDDAALERLLFPSQSLLPLRERAEPDWVWVHQELRRKSVTKQLLWMEYREQQPSGYQYSQFCDLYSRWAAKSAVTMRQVHRAGEKMFVDFSGDGIDIVDPRTGECRTAKLFVAVLGASNLTYVEAALSEDLATWTGCHVRAFEYFGGVAEITVPDNLRSGVKRPDYYDPEINPTYAELAEHYDTAVIPARVRKPRDKAKVEQGVLLAERWILAVLRNRLFHSLEEMNAAVKPLVEKLNDRPMQRLKKSRRQLFEEIERAALRPLPTTPYEFAMWKKVRVHIDYHVEFDEHFYSVHYALVGQQLEVRATETIVEIIDGGRSVASHPRSIVPHRHTTNPEHMPKAHRSYRDWTPTRLVAWAKAVGPNTEELIKEILGSRKHPEQGFRSCLGVMSLRKSFPDERIERACARAIRHRAYSRKSVLAILKNNLDRIEEPKHDEKAQLELPLHGNTRGGRYYH